MRDPRRKPWFLILFAILLLLVAVALLYVSAPDPTVLTVQVVDARTGVPLSGAEVQVRARSEQPLPIVVTGETGKASFRGLSPDLSYVVRAQKVDYDLAFEPQVAVPRGQETEQIISLVAHAGGRLYVGLDEAQVVHVDTASLLVMHTIRLSGWKQEPVGHLSLHPDRDLLYAVAGREGHLLDSQTGVPLAHFEVQQPVYRLSAEGTTLSVVTGAEIGATGRQNEEATPSLATAAARNGDSGRMLTLDALTGELLTSASTVNPRLALELIWQPNGGSAYVLEPFERKLWVLGINPTQALGDAPTGVFPKEGLPSIGGTYRHTWAEGVFADLSFREFLEPVPGLPSLPSGPSAWTIDPTGEDLYALDAELGALSITDLTGQEPPVLVAVGKQPVALAFSPDGQWAYVANRESHTVSVIQVSSSSVFHTISILGAPHSLAAR
jgi:YVTN family beta-propeller protein